MGGSPAEPMQAGCHAGGFKHVHADRAPAGQRVDRRGEGEGEEGREGEGEEEREGGGAQVRTETSGDGAHRHTVLLQYQTCRLCCATVPKMQAVLRPLASLPPNKCASATG